jgi:hypothetical protein
MIMVAFPKLRFGKNSMDWGWKKPPVLSSFLFFAQGRTFFCRYCLGEALHET